MHAGIDQVRQVETEAEPAGICLQRNIWDVRVHIIVCEKKNITQHDGFVLGSCIAFLKDLFLSGVPGISFPSLHVTCNNNAAIIVKNIFIY